MPTEKEAPKKSVTLGIASTDAIVTKPATEAQVTMVVSPPVEPGIEGKSCCTSLLEEIRMVAINALPTSNKAGSEALLAIVGLIEEDLLSDAIDDE